VSLLAAEPIAIVGLACRLPGGAHTPEQFWKNLCDGVDAVTDPPPGRWPEIPKNVPCRAGYLDKIDGFDAEFFGIPPREALHMDPQQRMLLEVTWEALWDAGMDPAVLGGSRTGVFTAVYNGFYERMLLNHPGELNAYSSGGTATSTASGRVAFLLDLNGPAVSINTACSSSLVTAHLACQSLRTRDCDMVLAGGVNLKLSATEMISVAQMGLLAPDGRAKTFDWRANGFVPGEGCVVTVLKRLSDALANGDNIRGVIRGTAINQDGRTSTFAAPNALAQAQLIRAAAANGRVDPSHVSFVEAHGTGTALGDPIEVEGLTEALAPHGENARKCVLGSVKTNIGHLEAAAGFAGLAKVVLALEKEAIPGNLHFERINPHIELEKTRFVLPQSLLPWARGDEPRFAGLSAFGFSGTNAHLILEEAPKLARRREKIAPRAWDRQPYWFVPREQKAPPPEWKELRLAATENRVWEVTLHAADSLGDHVIDGRPIVPFTMIADLLRQTAPELDLTDIEVHDAAEIGGELKVQAVLHPAGNVEFFVDHDGLWKRIAQARSVAHEEPRSTARLTEIRQRVPNRIDASGHYRSLEENGIRMGPSFQTLRESWSGKGEALAHVEVPTHVESFYRTALLLDGCLQAIGGLVADAARFVPIRVGRLSVQPGWRGDSAWAHLRLRDNASRDSVEFDVTLFDENGSVVATLQNVRLRARDAGLSEAFYEIAWREAIATATAQPTSKRWHVIGSETLIQALRSRGISQVETASAAEEIVWVGAEPAPALALLQECAQTGPKRLWFVTTFAQKVDSETGLNVAQAGTWGLVRTARREHPELQPVLIDTDNASWDAVAAELISGSPKEDQLAFRAGRRYVPRLVRKPMRDAAPWKLEAVEPGLLETISQRSCERVTPGPGFVEIETEALGLNFRDVLVALGMYPGKAALGCEIAGRISRVGPGVTSPQIGDCVIAVGSDVFASHVLLDARQVCALPSSLGPTDAVTLPVAHITALYALSWVGGIRPGDRVLIHAGAGGVGTAALQLAVRSGAEVYATASSEQKRAYVLSLGAKAVFNSREPNYAAAIRELTGGHGADLLLNSLNGPFHDENLRVLARGGQYLEIGKAGILSEAQVREARPDVRYHVLDWADLLASDPLRIQAVLQEIVAGLAAGTLSPMHKQVFAVEDASQAFRHMANGRHIGKVVLRVPSQKPILRDGTYLITGGLGALGLGAAEWLAGRSAGRLVLCGRKPATAEAATRIEQLRRIGAQVDVWTGDVTDGPTVRGWMERLDAERANLRGIIHSAGVLADGVLRSQTAESLQKVLQPKVQGAMHLAEQTVNRPLDFFVLYSSMAALVGAPGQANYAAANEQLNTLAQQMCLNGRSALSIAWGPWESEGMASHVRTSDWQKALPGVAGWSPSRGLKALEAICTSQTGVIAALRCHWPQARTLSHITRFFDELTGGPQPTPVQNTEATVARSGAGLLAYLEQQARQVMGLSHAQRLQPDQPLFDAGLDSLAAVEFRNILAAEFHRPLSSTLLFDYPTLLALARFFGQEPERPAPKASGTTLQEEIEGLSESEAEALLAAELGIGDSR
jgi:acyl transferase domain-containing protein